MNGTYCPESLLAAVRAGDAGAEAELLERNNGLIRSVCRRFRDRGVEEDDLYQLGCVGFIKAVRGFDPAFGTAFSTYAVPKIAGEIRRFLRDDGPVKISRALRQQAFVIVSARRALEQELGRSPTLSELAGRTGLTPEEIASAELAALPPDSLQRQAGEDGPLLEEVVGDWQQEDRVVERIALRQAMERLPIQEKRVLFLRYFRGMTQQAVAGIVGVSQVQVSRLEKRAVGRMRELLTP